jgi:hypothetical protein
MLPATIPTYRGNALHQLVADFVAAKAARKEAARLEGEARDAILAAMRGRPLLRVGDQVVRVREVAGTPGQTVTAAMVGQVLPGRRGHVALEVLGVDDDATA